MRESAAEKAGAAQMAGAAATAGAAEAAVGAAVGAPGLERAFAAVPAELSYEVREIAGELPGFLRGTCYWNGPARFARGGLRYRHWLDGDGMVCALHFGAGGVRFANRFVRSAKWVAEEEAGRPLFRTFGTAFPGDRLVHGMALESPVNVSVYPFAGTLLACGEQGLPWELDPVTLETRGRYTFGGGLNAVSPFAAHAKLDAATGELWNFGVSFAGARPCLNLYRFDRGGRLLARRRVDLEAPCALHDFCLSKRFAVFHLSPYLLDAQELRGAGRTPMEALSWQPERGSRLVVVRREDGATVASVPIGAHYCLHTINACEDEGGERLTVDVVELDRPVYDQYQELPDLFTSVAPGRPVRFVVGLRGGELLARREIAYELAPDFPAIDARHAGGACDDFWMLGIAAAGRPGRKFFDQLVHASWARPERPEVWQAPAGQYLAGEPLVVAEPGGGGGAVLVCLLFDAVREASRCLLFDPRAVSAGPIATLELAAPVPPVFHAAFAAGG
jgi:all-trans-8'-apo-beta-carotenal 15,15'-oxygenase